GMLVQTSHFLEKVGKPAHEAVTFYGQEKNATTIRFTKMNLAVHGLEGLIKEGNTYYIDQHNLLHKADFVMANPPFNVDEVDADKIKGDPRLPFGLPGVNKKKGSVSNGNYLWISYFWSYLNPKGRAGFVMSSQASAAGHGEKKVRQKIVESGDVDVMISIRSGFFYTRTVPCELWFFDRGKPKEKRNKVLMIDARIIARRMEGSRRVWEFSPEQQKNLTAIVWLYRGKTDRYLGLVKEYLRRVVEESGNIDAKLKTFDEKLAEVRSTVSGLEKGLTTARAPVETKKAFKEAMSEWDEVEAIYKKDCSDLLKAIGGFRKKYGSSVPESNSGQLGMQKECEPIAEHLKGLVKQVDHLFKVSGKAIDAADAHHDDDERKNGGKNDENNHHNNQRAERRKANQLRKELDEVRKAANEQLKLVAYFDRQAHWLQSRFPDAKLSDVEGLVKLVDRREIEKNDWSLTPGRYVGVAPAEEDEDFDFEETLREIHSELAGLNKEAEELAKTIQRNFEDFGI
ncbi:MAG: N-6 DNA methylase, partial [Bacteroidota bacterium]